MNKHKVCLLQVHSLALPDCHPRILSHSQALHNIAYTYSTGKGVHVFSLFESATAKKCSV